MIRRDLWSAVLALSALACAGPSVDHPDPTFIPDAAEASPPPIPELEDVPAATPYDVVTLTGVAPGARRVLIEGVPNAPATAVLPDGSFCVDVRIGTPGSYTLRVYAQSDSGLLSNRAVTVPVTVSPTASPVAGAQTCSGADPAGCSSAQETCGNGRDDNCDGLIDDHDPACVSCDDDVLGSPTANAPRVDPGRYEGLTLCPGAEDYFGVHLNAGETLAVSLLFAEGNLDLSLLAPDREQILERSMSADPDEYVTYIAERDGDYLLRIISLEGGTVPYTLQVYVSR